MTHTHMLDMDCVARFAAELINRHNCTTLTMPGRLILAGPIIEFFTLAIFGL